VPAPVSFHYVELPAGSLERAKAFYRHVFGWEFQAPPPEHGRTDVVYLDGPPEIGLCEGAVPAPGAGIRPAVAVDSIDATLARVTEAGGSVVAAKVDVGDGFTGAFADSEGNHIGLWEFASPPGTQA